MEGDLSSEVGLAGRLFKACVDLYWAILQRLEHLHVTEKQRRALREEFGRFYFWGDGYNPYEGRLDEILLSSSRLRRRVLSVMVEVAQLICSDKNSLLSLAQKAFGSADDPEFKRQCLELQSLTDIISQTFEEPSGNDSDTDSETSELGDLFQEILGSLRSRNQCLIDLSASLDRPAADAGFAEPENAPLTASAVSGPAEIWTRKVMDSFPLLERMLAERLGEANWQRYQRISKQLEAMIPLGSDSSSDDSAGSGEDELPELPVFSETTISSKKQSSIFSSQAPQSSGLGTTVMSTSQTGFENAFPRRRRAAKDVRSQVTYTSVLTDDQGERGWMKIPALPKNALSGKAFQCTVCGERQKDILSRTDWKRHVFADLKPYICTFADCKLGLASFGTRKAWADHEFSIHRVSKIWACHECGSDFTDKEKFREHAKRKHASGFTRAQLELFINNAEKKVEAVIDYKCPFCVENAGTKVRPFSMHVAKHMEEIALAVLPREGEFEDDRASLASDESGTTNKHLKAQEQAMANMKMMSDITDRLNTVIKRAGDEFAASATQGTNMDEFKRKEEDLEPSDHTRVYPWKGKVGLSDFNFLATIGRGNFAKILLAEAKTSKQLFTVKILKKEFLVENDEVNSIKEEKRTLLLAAREVHPFIVQVYSTFQTETRVYFVMEYINGGDLMLHIQRGPFSRAQTQFYAAQLLIAIEFLHEKGIIYRDVKLDNVLLGTDGYIKLVDFGLCKSGLDWKTKTRTFCGTPEFMAPEILLDKMYGFEVDWWAFGVLIYQMLMQQSPFRGEDEDEIYDAVLADEPLYPIHLPRPIVSLMQKLLRREPSLRLGEGPNGAQDIKKHIYFANVNWDDIFLKRVEPPFIPTIKSSMDTSNFDKEFTSITPKLTPVQSVLTNAMQEEFRGFSHIVS